jgi:hypothetical protein
LAREEDGLRQLNLHPNEASGLLAPDAPPPPHEGREEKRGR